MPHSVNEVTFVNEMTFGQHLGVGAGCQGNQPQESFLFPRKPHQKGRDQLSPIIKSWCGGGVAFPLPALDSHSTERTFTPSAWAPRCSQLSAPCHLLMIFLKNTFRFIEKLQRWSGESLCSLQPASPHVGIVL